ncbi:pentatricopeptide repeat-containing protein [Hordeum vulgare]|nr:pentatricopeptide repeat-containing protein [Hordeum vulgare]
MTFSFISNPDFLDVFISNLDEYRYPRFHRLQLQDLVPHIQLPVLGDYSGNGGTGYKGLDDGGGGYYGGNGGGCRQPSGAPPDALLRRQARAQTAATVPSSSCRLASEGSRFPCGAHRRGSHADASHASLLLRLRSGPALAEARRLHASVLVGGHRHGAVLSAQLVQVYARLGQTGHALRVLDGMPRRNSFAWNAAIKGLVDAGRFSEALETYRAMVDDGSVAADGFTYPPVIKACAVLGAVEQGRVIRDHVEAGVARGDATPNVFVQCALVNMFAKCGCLGEARSVFESMQEKDVVAWTAMIGGAVHAGDWLDAMCLFNRMRSEGFSADSVIIATVIPACGRVKELRAGTALHGCAVRCGVADDNCVSNALVDMYCKCGCLEMADYLFRSIYFKDVVSWSTLIAGYSQNGMYHVSVSLFTEMVAAGLKPNSNTMASILPSLSGLKLFRHGKEVHGFSLRYGLDQSKFLGSAFIDFYSRQGFLREAATVFELIPKKICHAGLTEKGLHFYNSMLQDYNISPDKEHYSCVVDLYSRSGKLDDAWKFISSLREGTEIDVLGCLLAACRVHNRMDIAELVAERIFEKNPSDPGYHILLSNIYADAGMCVRKKQQQHRPCLTSRTPNVDVCEENMELCILDFEGKIRTLPESVGQEAANSLTFMSVAAMHADASGESVPYGLRFDRLTCKIQESNDSKWESLSCPGHICTPTRKVPMAAADMPEQAMEASQHMFWSLALHNCPPSVSQEKKELVTRLYGPGLAPFMGNGNGNGLASSWSSRVCTCHENTTSAFEIIRDVQLYIAMM